MMIVSMVFGTRKYDHAGFIYHDDDDEDDNDDDDDVTYDGRALSLNSIFSG
jgi:hypothetical protein